MNRVYFTLLLLLSSLFLFNSCRKKGCTDPLGSNYNKHANYDDGSCDYVYGCTDSGSVNFNSSAKIDDGSCKSFAHWKKWTLIASSTGMDTLNLGIAHEGNNNISTRSVYKKNGFLTTNTVYPEGTMIINHVSPGDSLLDQFPAMVKMKKGYSKTSNDWEWFMLRKDGSIARDSTGNQLRGANLYDGSCTKCHAKAAIDFVFSR